MQTVPGIGEFQTKMKIHVLSSTLFNLCLHGVKNSSRWLGVAGSGWNMVWSSTSLKSRGGRSCRWGWRWCVVGGSSTSRPTTSLVLQLPNIARHVVLSLYTKKCFKKIWSCDCYSQLNFREGSRYQIGWIFGKNPNRLRPPPPIFGKLWCKFFIIDVVAYMQGGMRALFKVPKIYNNFFWTKNDALPFGTFPKIRPIW